MGHSMRMRHRREDRGAAAVEFALIMPILLILVFGIIQYGLYFWAMQGGSDIARGAARLSAVGDPAACAAFKNEIKSNIDGLTGTGSTATIQRIYTNGPSNTAPAVEIGDYVTVHVEFTSYDLGLPLVPFIDDGVVTSTAKARVDYVPATPEACP